VNEEELKSKSTWALFDEMFKVGDDVVLIDDDDRFIVGKLTRVDDERCYIDERPHLRCVEWNDIRFICHDGFPVRKLRGADGSKLIEKLDTTDTKAMIRQTLTTSICANCGKLFPNDYMYYARQCHECLHVVFGDPFMAEAMSVTLYNSGNDSSRFWLTEWEECLALEARDGAMAQVFDLSTVYYFGWV